MQFKFLALGALVASAVAAPTTALTGWTVKNFRRSKLTLSTYRIISYKKT